MRVDSDILDESGREVKLGVLILVILAIFSIAYFGGISDQFDQENTDASDNQEQMDNLSDINTSVEVTRRVIGFPREPNTTQERWGEDEVIVEGTISTSRTDATPTVSRKSLEDDSLQIRLSLQGGNEGNVTSEDEIISYVLQIENEESFSSLNLKHDSGLLEGYSIEFSESL